MGMLCRLETSGWRLQIFIKLVIMCDSNGCPMHLIKHSHYKVFSRHLTRESSRHCSKLQVYSWGMFIEVNSIFRCKYIHIDSIANTSTKVEHVKMLVLSESCLLFHPENHAVKVTTLSTMRIAQLYLLSNCL